MDKKAFLVKLGQNIRQEREKQKLSRQTLAERAGMSIDFLGGIEKARQNPSILKILDISEALDTNFIELVTFD
jgi:transcriptional regulator with XRE-family HTH domain